ncbi:hypothetical protein ACSVH2_08530 [Flavobacterium sp. RSB2_4_14]|uniref:hypothetical protein n=1 Tax=Flavobacterium sp. RSB2_4_14 TaxID=3447665 RepID=UPI003F32A358
MTFRDLTIEELFPQAIQQDLLKKQSESFVNKTIATGSITAGYENMPTKLNPIVFETPLTIKSPPQFFMGTYVKNHWRVIVASMVIGGVIGLVVYYVAISNQKKQQEK